MYVCIQTPFAGSHPTARPMLTMVSQYELFTCINIDTYVHVCVFKCINIDTHVHACVCVCVYVCLLWWLNIHTHTTTLTRMYKGVCNYIFKYRCWDTYVYITYVNIQICVITITQTHASTHIHTRTHRHMHTRTHTHIHTHECTPTQTFSHTPDPHI